MTEEEPPHQRIGFSSLSDGLIHRPRRWLLRRSVFGVAGLRPPIAEHTEAEGRLLQSHASGARCIVELGVAEGGSAVALREVMDPHGTLVLVDPSPPGRLFGRNMAEIVARRTVASVPRGDVIWIRQSSERAGSEWQREIDFLFIDADHSFAAVIRDWELWTPCLREGGLVALHDAVVAPETWITDDDGPARLLKRLRSHPSWRLVGSADTMAVLEKTGSGTATALQG